MGGTSGRALECFVVVTPMPRSLPDFTWGAVAGMLPKISWIWPPRSALIAGPVPLYGICVILIPAIRSKNSVARWVMPPVPVEP